VRLPLIDLGVGVVQGLRRPPRHSARWAPACKGHLPQSSRLFFFIRRSISTCGSPLVFFDNPLQKQTFTKTRGNCELMP